MLKPLYVPSGPNLLDAYCTENYACTMIMEQRYSPKWRALFSSLASMFLCFASHDFLSSRLCPLGWKRETRIDKITPFKAGLRQ